MILNILIFITSNVYNKNFNFKRIEIGTNFLGQLNCEEYTIQISVLTGNKQTNKKN